MIRKSILGGICIGIGSLIYLKFPTPIGATFFSAGLLLIMTLNYKLYTGVIGSARTKQDFKNAFIILIGNAVGALIALLSPQEAAQNIVITKLAASWISIFFRSILCGGIIYGCVEAHKQHNDILVILFVAAFILSGAEHSIADICYFIAGRAQFFPALLFTITVAFGNMIGAQLFSRVSLLNI